MAAQHAQVGILIKQIHAVLADNAFDLRCLRKVDLNFNVVLLSNPIEQFIEDQTGVSIDSDGDGSVTVESEDGEMTITAGTEVPDDFPGEVPLPSTGALESSVAMAPASS